MGVFLMSAELKSCMRKEGAENLKKDIPITFSEEVSLIGTKGEVTLMPLPPPNAKKSNLGFKKKIILPLHLLNKKKLQKKKNLQRKKNPQGEVSEIRYRRLFASNKIYAAQRSNVL